MMQRLLAINLLQPFPFCRAQLRSPGRRLQEFVAQFNLVGITRQQAIECRQRRFVLMVV